MRCMKSQSINSKVVNKGTLTSAIKTKTTDSSYKTNRQHDIHIMLAIGFVIRNVLVLIHVLKPTHL